MSFACVDMMDSPAQPRRDFKKDISEFNQKPVADVIGEDKQAAND